MTSFSCQEIIFMGERSRSTSDNSDPGSFRKGYSPMVEKTMRNSESMEGIPHLSSSNPTGRFHDFTSPSPMSLHQQKNTFLSKTHKPKGVFELLVYNFSLRDIKTLKKMLGMK
jgi:hypothetical protein